MVLYKIFIIFIFLLQVITHFSKCGFAFGTSFIFCLYIVLYFLLVLSISFINKIYPPFTLLFRSTSHKSFCHASINFLNRSIVHKPKLWESSNHLGSVSIDLTSTWTCLQVDAFKRNFMFFVKLLKKCNNFIL